MTRVIRTFRIMDSNQRSLAFVQTADNEEITDNPKVMMTKRRAKAQLMLQRWKDSLAGPSGLSDTDLHLVACDHLGRPIPPSSKKRR